MDRKEFLSMIGLTGASTLLACAGCTKTGSSASTTGPSNVDFTLDISTSAYAALQTNGGYVYANGLIVAKTTAGKYVAVQQSCTHENQTLIYQAQQDRFYCDRHGGTFSDSGAVLGGPPPTALKTYNTSLTGTSLRVYS